MMTKGKGISRKKMATKAPADSVQKPPQASGELPCLRAGENHRVVEGVKKTALVDPAFLLDQQSVHDGDLPGRSAEAEQRNLDPNPKCFSERWAGELYV
jgi:hypothetical protein